MAARFFRIFWLVVLVLHAMLAMLWWWLEPGGFPVNHPRFFSNRVAPIVVLILAFWALWDLHRERVDWLRYLLPIWPAAWSTIAITGKIVFPISLALAWLVPLAAAAMMAIATLPVFKRSRGLAGTAPVRRARLLASSAVSALTGAALVGTQLVPIDYPFGRPARLAYLDRFGIFRVVEAETGEKGPFRTLARGPLARDEPLSITFFDEGRRRAKITLEDWARQTDTRLSPTAGWGVPVNAIEFSSSGDDAQSPASIFVTLAGTSVGRGWDCVAHAAGIYRNRILLEQVSDDLTTAGSQCCAGPADGGGFTSLTGPAGGAKGGAFGSRSRRT